MTESGLRARLEKRYGVEGIAKMSVAEYDDALRREIRVAQSANGFEDAKRSGIRHVAALEFPHLSPAQLEDIVSARMAP
jgi:hypothetical protein